MDADGTKDGYDLELIRPGARRRDVPVIASGGAGKLADFAPAVQAGADAVLAASVFHFGDLTIGEVKASLRAERHRRPLSRLRSRSWLRAPRRRRRAVPSYCTWATRCRPNATRASSTGSPVTVTRAGPVRPRPNRATARRARTRHRQRRSVSRAAIRSFDQTACCRSIARLRGCHPGAGPPHVLVVDQVLEQVDGLADRRQRERRIAPAGPARPRRRCPGRRCRRRTRRFAAARSPAGARPATVRPTRPASVPAARDGPRAGWWSTPRTASGRRVRRPASDAVRSVRSSSAWLGMFPP